MQRETAVARIVPC